MLWRRGRATTGTDANYHAIVLKWSPGTWPGDADAWRGLVMSMVSIMRGYELLVGLYQVRSHQAVCERLDTPTHIAVL